MRRASSERKRIVVLGGGFAGLSAAVGVQSDRHAVTLIDRNRWFEFLPNIHELISGVKTPELLRLPLDRAMERAGHTFVRDTVTAIDPTRKTVSTQRRRRPIGYDALIVSLGGVNATHGVPGVVEHAMPFKSVDQCHRIGGRLKRIAGRRRAARIVIVGGGLEGVEALGEILRAHREACPEITVVEARERLLSEAPSALDAHVRELCAPYPVEFVTGHPVQRVEPEAVVLADGRSLPSDLTIWTGGPAPPPLLADCGLAPRGAWAPVEPSLRSKSFPEVFVAGDAADLPTPLTKQGYHALDMGACAARNAARLLADDDLEPFRPSGKPTLISFGDLSCFLVLDERALAGAALGAAKEAVFELVMAQLDAEPLWRRLPRAVQRTARAAQALAWPSVSSLDSLRRQGRITLLPKD